MRGFIVWATQQEKSATSPYTPHRVGIFKIKFINNQTKTIIKYEENSYSVPLHAYEHQHGNG